MNIDSLAQQVSTLSERLTLLLDRVGSSPYPNPEIVFAVFKEMGIAIEELQVAVEELQQQNEALTEAVESAAIEHRRYQDLFQFAPQAYLITTLEGRIQEANWMAAQLFGVPEQFLIGKPMILFVNEPERSLYWVELRQRQQRDYFQEWELRLKTRSQKILDVACLTVAVRDHQGQPTGFRWAFRDITERKRLEALARKGEAFDTESDAVLHHRPIYTYDKEDLIPLQHQSIWYIKQGLVKLTTLTEQGKELMLGLIGPGMPFGTFLTSRTLYQAIAQSDVQLVSIPLTEITGSPYLSELLFVRTNQRLQQTETLLTILGERIIEDRLYQLLLLLKAEIGQPIAQGTRLDVRLTHEDLANACCSTRVTITRSLGKLQREGKIMFDNKHHIILLERPSSESRCVGSAAV